ncbi:MAG TPA: helix-turn-helix domain-containing protein [Acidimicrobiales bacterium]|nr:helix-turn-helix domain-containing protein [Acidimicrobiales bacterium]
MTLADLGARCRSPVVRDRYKGDNVEIVPEPENPGRLVGALSQLAAGMRAVGTPDDELWRLTREAALGGIHPIRRAVIDYLARPDDAHAAETIAARCRLKESTARRHLEDLEALEVLDRLGTRPACWRLAPTVSRQWPGQTAEDA